MAKELSAIEKNTLKVFTINFTKQLQKIQNCKTYEEVKELIKEIDKYLENDNREDAFSILMDKIHNYDEKI